MHLVRSCSEATIWSFLNILFKFYVVIFYILVRSVLTPKNPLVVAFTTMLMTGDVLQIH